MRIPVLAPDGTPLMPTTPSRCRRWLRDGKAKVVHNDLGIFCIQLITEPCGRKTQDIVVGIDPGKLFSGVGVASAKATLLLAHLVLPFQNVTKKMNSISHCLDRRWINSFKLAMWPIFLMLTLCKYESDSSVTCSVMLTNWAGTASECEWLMFLQLVNVVPFKVISLPKTTRNVPFTIIVELFSSRTPTRWSFMTTTPSLTSSIAEMWYD